jgi:hypothetical protein
MTAKANAARASHPSRIVVANILPAVSRHERKSIASPALVRAHNPTMFPRGSHLEFSGQRFHPALEGRISLEAATPGHQFTGREPDFPR